MADKKEWPEWQAQADMVERKLAPSGVMKGGPRNPLGARILLLDDGSLSIHGTNAPATKVDGPSCTFPTRASCPPPPFLCFALSRASVALGPLRLLGRTRTLAPPAAFGQAL